MFSLEYTFKNSVQFIEALSEKLRVKSKNNWLFFPETLADGYLRILQLPNGLNINILNCRANDDWMLYRRKDVEEYYTLRFDQLHVPGKIKIGIDNQIVERQGETIAVAYLTSSLFDWQYQGTKGSTLKWVNILIPKEWLGKLLGLELFDDILPAYIGLRSRSFRMEPLDNVYLKLLDEIMQEEPDTPFPKLHTVNLVQLLLERFFTRVHTRISVADVDKYLKQDDIYMMLRIEKMLVENFSAKPKSIEYLSKEAAMSSTKLKKMFKSVFGLPVYEYYQQKRMQRASELLATGRYSVKAVGEMMGYSNISNFTTAFRKQMKVSPAEFKKTTTA